MSGQFNTFEEWVLTASTALTAHPLYDDSGAGQPPYRVLCFDSRGRRCATGADFMRARDDGSFPVHYLWPDEIARAHLAEASDARLLAEQAEHVVAGFSSGKTDLARALAEQAALAWEKGPGSLETHIERAIVQDRASRLNKADVEWVTNDIAELGVKIGEQFFFMYKGHSLAYDEPTHEDGSPMHWRPIGKREFGECVHPINRTDPTRIGTVSLDDSDEWKPLPPAGEPNEPSTVALPIEPTDDMLRAITECVAVDDEGTFPPLFDLLDFTGANKTRTIVRAIYSTIVEKLR